MANWKTDLAAFVEETTAFAKRSLRGLRINEIEFLYGEKREQKIPKE